MRKTILLLTLILLTGYVSAGTINYGNHNITFLGVSGPENGLCNWSYHVCSGTQPSISHWTLESCIGTTNPEIQWDTIPELGGKIEYGTDPTTGVTGLKFDDLPSDFGCATFWFRVKECTITTQEVGLKAGQDIYTGSYIEGPAHASAPEFLTPAIGLAILLTSPAFAYLLIKKQHR